MKHRLVLALISAAAIGCSSSSSEGGGDGGGSTSPDAATAATGDSGAAHAGDAATAPDAATASDASTGAVAATFDLTLPADFSGATRELDVVLVDKVPVAGPPASIVYVASAPAYTPGQSIPLVGDIAGVHGDYWVMAVLYMKGGGGFSPKPGVDYASAPFKHSFDGAPTDLGTIALSRVPVGDAGP